MRWLPRMCFLLVLAPGQAPGEQIALAAEGRARAVIVRPSGKLTSSESVGLRDLRKYLTRITGAEFQTVFQGSEPVDKARIYVGRVAAGLGVDPARLEKDEWDHAARLTDFRLFGRSDLAEEQTEVYLTWDSDRLYVGFRCTHTDPRIVSRITERDGPVWDDEAMASLRRSIRS